MMGVETETEKIVAVLHEVVEDRPPSPRWGFDELRRDGFSEPVLAALECGDAERGRDLGGVYSPFADPSGRRRGKLADPEDNLGLRWLPPSPTAM